MDPHTFAPHGQRRRSHAPVEAQSDGRAASEREALLRVAGAVAGAHTLDEVLELAAEEARTAVGAASLAVSRWDRPRGVLRTLINVGELGPGEERFPQDETYAIAEHRQLARMLLNGEPYFNAVDDPTSDAAAVGILRSLGKESDVAVPIITEGESWGEVWASTAAGQPRFRAEDVQFLQAIAGQLAIAIGRAELFSEVSRLAYEDPLTGLANRRAVEERLERAVARATAESGPAMLLCDVDNLKAINDHRGHEAGDRALCRVADALVAGSAGIAGALVARLAGDEFCVLFEQGGLKAARQVAEGALETLAADRDMPVSISCGAAAFGPAARTPDQLLRAADAAQYAAKRRGGGQFLTAVAGASPVTGATRRAFRGSTEERVRMAAATATRLLDGELLGRPVVDRFEAVAQTFAEAVNAAAWTVSFAPIGSSVIHSVCTADSRDVRLRGLRIGLEQEVYPLDDYPTTKRLIEAGSGTFLVERADPTADPAERELLDELGHEAVLGVTAADLDGTYLVEMYADDATAPLAAGELELGLLARAAIPARPAGHTPSVRLLRRAQQLELTSKLSARLAGATEQDSILTAVVQELHRTLGYSICAILRVTDDDMQEVVAADNGAGPGRWPNWRVPLTYGLIGRALSEGRPLLTNDVTKEPAYRPTEHTAQTRAELDVPIRVGDRVWGAITVQENHVDAFDEDDVNLLVTIADQLGAALRSVSLFEQLERAYLGTAEALAAALEAKDSYTASHSDSIVTNAEAVGRLLGLDETELWSLKLGAAFHDIGKLAVPEAILNKRGPLSDEERQIIERHPEAGEMILARVEFLQPVLPLVRHGHERWDGFGYPDGLAGEDIPLGARIIFACDAWDAMTTDRPYRAAMHVNEARAEMRRASGSQFDPKVVDALLRVLDLE